MGARAPRQAMGQHIGGSVAVGVATAAADVVVGERQSSVSTYHACHRFSTTLHCCVH